MIPECIYSFSSFFSIYSSELRDTYFSYVGPSVASSDSAIKPSITLGTVVIHALYIILHESGLISETTFLLFLQNYS